MKKTCRTITLILAIIGAIATAAALIYVFRDKIAKLLEEKCPGFKEKCKKVEEDLSELEGSVEEAIEKAEEKVEDFVEDAAAAAEEKAKAIAEEFKDYADVEPETTEEV